jgi:hypothetical protein
MSVRMDSVLAVVDDLSPAAGSSNHAAVARRHADPEGGSAYGTASRIARVGRGSVATDRNSSGMSHLQTPTVHTRRPPRLPSRWRRHASASPAWRADVVKSRLMTGHTGD